MLQILNIFSCFCFKRVLLFSDIFLYRKFFISVLFGFALINFNVIEVLFAFSDLTLLVGRQEEHCLLYTSDAADE